MSFEKSCFLSYRQRAPKDYEATLAEFHQMLESELQLHLNLQSFFDPQRPAENFVTRSLASTLCRSLCMVVLYIPTYFDSDYRACAREYKAMEVLEKRRMDKLGHTNKKTHGLIIPVVYRGWEEFPEAIKRERTCYNIQPYTVSKSIRKNAKVKGEISKIAQYIYARYLELQTIEDPCSVCVEFEYPDETGVSAFFATLQTPRQQKGLPL